MAIANGGDILARGAKSATFEGPSQCVPGCECAVCKPRPVVDEPELPALVDNSARFAPKKPAVIYRGEPLNDRILIKRVERESDSMILIPDAAKGKSDTGVIVSVSPVSNLGLEAGQMVLFDKFAAVGQEVELFDEDGGKQTYLLVQECDILLKLTAFQRVETGTCVQ